MICVCSLSMYCHSFVKMANQDSPLWERLGVDHDVSPPWTLLNMAKAVKFRWFIIPPEQQTLEMNKTFQMVNNRATYPLTHLQASKQSLFPLQEQTTAQYLPSMKSTSSISTCV